MSWHTRSLETISRPYRHFVSVFLVSVRFFSRVRLLARNMSFFSASLFRFSLFHPCSSLQEQDSCRPPISRTRISPLKIFNFNIFLHRAAFTSSYIITALLHSSAYSRNVKESGEEAFARSENISFFDVDLLENRLEGNIIFCDLSCRYFFTCLVYFRMIKIQLQKVRLLYFILLVRSTYF